MTWKRILVSFAIVTTFLLLAFVCACSNIGQNEPSIPTSNSLAIVETPTVTPEPNDMLEVSSTSATQPDEISNPYTPDIITGEVIITFDYEKQSGSASNQFAVWIENMDGQIIKTLYATRYTTNGGYKNRPDSIALWVEKSDIANMTKSEVDAISGATPKAGALSYTWDLTDINGVSVLPGEYRFLVEGTLRWKNFVLYSGVIEICDKPSFVLADAEFTYEGSDRYAVLSEDSPENNMIGAVTARLSPIP